MATINGLQNAVYNSLDGLVYNSSIYDDTYLMTDGTNKMNNNLDMNNNRLINVSNPINAQDGATKKYTDDNFVTLNTIQTISGLKNMYNNTTGHGILGVSRTATGNINAIRFNNTSAGIVQFSIGNEADGTNDISINKNGSTPMMKFKYATNEIDICGNKIINVSTPTSNGDAVNKSYVDTLGAGYVTLSTNQQITGEKEFKNTFFSNNSYISLTKPYSYSFSFLRFNNHNYTNSYDYGRSDDDRFYWYNSSAGGYLMTLNGNGGLMLGGGSIGGGQKLYVDGSAYIDGLCSFNNNIDMLSGRIENLGAPINAGDATNKNYVDSAISGAVAGYVRLAGASQTISAPTFFYDGNDGIVSTVRSNTGRTALTSYVTDGVGVDFTTGSYFDGTRDYSIIKNNTTKILTVKYTTPAIDCNNYNIINVATPVNANDGATKNYVDTAISAGLSNYVTTNTDQTITSSKTFTANEPIKLDRNKGDNFITINGGLSGLPLVKMGQFNWVTPYFAIQKYNTGLGYYEDIATINNGSDRFTFRNLNVTGAMNITGSLNVSGAVNITGPINCSGTLSNRGIISVGISNDPYQGYSTALPNPTLCLLRGAVGANNGTSRIYIGGDNSHYSAIEGKHTSGGSSTLTLMTTTSAFVNSGLPLSRLHIDSNGLIGIGTTGPTSLLDVRGGNISVSGGINCSGPINVTGTTTLRGLVNASGTISHTGSNNLLTGKYTIVNPVNANSDTLVLSYTGGSAYGYMSYYRGTNKAWDLGIDPVNADNYYFYNPTYGQVVNLTKGGYLGIGVIAPAYQLELSLDSAFKPTSDLWQTTSDIRIKDNITDADNDILYNTVKNLKLKYFKWNEQYMPNVEDKHMIGWIAQEVETYYPKAVTTTPEKVFNKKKTDPFEDIKDDSEELKILDFKSLDCNQLYKANWGATQKLIEKVEALENEVKELNVFKEVVMKMMNIMASQN